MSSPVHGEETSLPKGQVEEKHGSLRADAEARPVGATPAPGLPNHGSRVLGWLSIADGVAALVGWAFDLPTLKSVLPGVVAMKVNTALGFVLAGLSLAIVTRGPASLLATRTLACATALIGILTLAQYVFHLDLGIDQLLFQEPPAPGRAPRTPSFARATSSSTASTAPSWGASCA